MKIALISHGRVNPDGNNGIARTVYNLNRYLNEHGIETHILCFDDRQREYGTFERDEHTRVHLFPREHWLGGSRMAKFISEQKFDLLHFHLPWMLDKCELLRRLKWNIPYVITTHAAYAQDRLSFKKNISLRTFEGTFLHRAACVHALCHEEKCDLRSLGLDNPMTVIPNGLNDVELKRIAEGGATGSDPCDHDFINLVLVARLRPDKNVFGIIRMLDFLPPEIAEKVRINLVGDGVEPYLSQVKKLARKYPDKVIFHGPKYAAEKYAFICKADIYLQPSFSEGISFSILDAMASGTPMILSRQTNMTHYYNENFYLMTETFPEDIAEAVTVLAKNEALRKKLGENARRMVETVFSWQNLIRRYADMYENVLTDLRRNHESR